MRLEKKQTMKMMMMMELREVSRRASGNGGQSKVRERMYEARYISLLVMLSFFPLFFSLSLYSSVDLNRGQVMMVSLAVHTSGCDGGVKVL